MLSASGCMMSEMKSRSNVRVPDNSVPLESKPLLWPGMHGVICRLPPTVEALEMGSSEDHICLHMSNRVRLWAYTEGRVDSGYSVPGNLSLNTRQEQYSIRWEGEEATAMSLFLSPQLMQHTVAEVSSCDPERITLVRRFNFQDPLLYQFLLALYGEIESNGLFGRPYIEALGNALALHLLRHYASLRCSPSTLVGRRLSQRQIAQVRDYIYDHLGDGVSLAGMASTLGFSISYFTRLFRQATGVSPHQYVIRCRVERARELLLDSSLSLAEIAQHVGFSDQSHMHRHLKRSLGLTPGDLRSAL